jgi:hypothetical protein
MTKPTELVCPAPFSNIVLRETNASFCCLSKEVLQIKPSELKSIDEIWNSDFFKQARQSMIDGNYEFCDSRCPALRGVPQVAPSPTSDQDFKDHKIELPIDRLSGLTLNYDTTCNLTCPSCRDKVITSKIGEVYEPLLAPLLSSEGRIHNVYLSGAGDPIASTHHRKWLLEFRNEDHPALEEIQIATNGLLFTEIFWNSLSDDLKSKRLMLIVSVDAATVGTYKKVRRGGNFDRLKKNLEFMQTLRADGKLYRFKLNYIIQAENFREILDFVEFGNSFGPDFLHFSEIVSWPSTEKGYYKKQAVWETWHPNHQEYLKIIRHPVLKACIYEGVHSDIWGQGLYGGFDEASAYEIINRRDGWRTSFLQKIKSRRDALRSFFQNLCG